MNFQQYFATATFTELSHDPLFWVAVVLAVVTTAIAVARREHVARRRSGAVGAIQGQEVIHSKRVPKTLWATAIGTATMPPVKGELPIGSSEVIRQFGLARVVAIDDESQLLAIVHAVLAHPLALLIRMCKPPLARLFGVDFRVAALNKTLAFALGVKVARAPIPVGFAAIDSVACRVLTFPLTALIHIAGTPRSHLLTGASLALRAQSIRAAAFLGKEVCSRSGKILVAFRAEFDGFHSSNYTANRGPIGCQAAVT